MNRREKIVFWIAIAITLAATLVGVIRARSIRVLTGAVLRQDVNLGKQLPIANAEITVSDDLFDGSIKSDTGGYFNLKLRRPIRKGEALTLHLRHPEYRPLDVTTDAADRLYVLRMTPSSAPSIPEGMPTSISDVRLRYAIKRQTTMNVGSVVKVFEVPNTGDIPCGSKGPCSPDGKWQASIGGTTIDAGDDNQFQEARLSCIAGPCPFTKIEKDAFSRGGRQISAFIRNWSDATTFILEAEVMRTMSSDVVLQTFPVIFSGTASFTLPANAQGPSIDATVDHEEIVYPLGPKPKLSWADCEVQIAKDRTKLFSCVLKPGYEFH